MNESTPQHVIVVGGGIAGVSTVAGLREGGFDGAVTLVDAGELPYDRPPLSKEFLLGTKDLKQIALQPAEWFDARSVRLLNRTTVTDLLPAEGSVRLDTGDVLSADRVVLATGGRAARPPIPGSDSPRIHVLRSVDDAEGLRAALGPGVRFLVVGAGLIGAETASTAVDLGCEVTLVDPVAVPLAAAVGEEVGAWLHGLHAARGVQVVAAGVQSFRDTGSAVEVQLTGEEAPRTVDVVLMGVGMVPETALAEAAGLEVDRGIVVDPSATTSNPAVLAVGDPARVRRDGVLMRRTEHWEAAQLDGRGAAATILGRPAPETGCSWFWTDRHGRHVEVVGDVAGAERLAVRGTLGAGPFAVFALTADAVVGVVAVDVPQAARAGRRLVDRGLRVDDAELTDPGTDLRALLRR